MQIIFLGNSFQLILLSRANNNKIEAGLNTSSRNLN